MEYWRLYDNGWSRTPRFLRYVIALFMGGCVSIGCNTTFSAPSEKESIEIYQLAIRQIYKSQDDFLGHPDKANLYIVRTITNVGDSRGIDSTNPAMFGKAIESGLTQQLFDLPSKIEFVDKFEQVQLDPKTRSPVAKGIVLSLGKIQIHHDQAFVYVSLYLAPLAAVGKNYIVERRNGTWVVTGTKGKDWQS